MKLLGMVILSAPFIWEVWNDRHGDSHSSRSDVIVRGAIAIAAAALTWIIGIAGFIVSLFMSGAIHFMFFDYTVTYVLIRNKKISANSKWWDYLGSKGFDTYTWWRTKSCGIRMLIKLSIFVICCIMYFRW